jgi:HEAT repeat protein
MPNNKLSNNDETIIICKILELKAEKPTMSIRAITEELQMDRKVISRIMKSEEYRMAVLDMTNDRLSEVRCRAIEKLEEIINTSKNNNEIIKACTTILTHSTQTSSLMLKHQEITEQLNANNPNTSIDDLMKMIEDM